MQDAIAEGIRALSTAVSPTQLVHILTNYPALLTPEADHILTRMIQAAWGEQNKVGTALFLSCRAFLHNARTNPQHAIPSPATVAKLPPGDTLIIRLSLLDKLFRLPASTDTENQRMRGLLADQVLKRVRLATEPDLWATMQVEVANGFVLGFSEKRTDLLENALDRLLAAIDVWQGIPAADFNKLPAAQEKLATIHHILGGLRMEQVDGDPLDHVAKSIRHYEAALTMRTPDKLPDHWAESMTDLAVTYTGHPGPDRAEYIKTAVSLLRDVHDHINPEQYPVQWGRSMVALGNAIVLRLSGSRLENLEDAIACYHEALRVFDPTTHAFDRARAYYNLAIAHRFFPIDHAQNLAQCHTNLLLTLKEFTEATHPKEWAYAQTVLGNICCNPEMEGDWQENLGTAVAHYTNALRIRTREHDPNGWATVLNNLGNAYADLERPDRATNQEKAIACYRLALEIRTPQKSPARWAETMNNLGTVYSEGRFGNYEENQKKAEACLRDALEVHEPDTYPHDSRRAARNLATILFAREQWREAAAFYTKAIAASENLYRAGATQQARYAELHEVRDLSAHAAYCLAKDDDFETAVTILDAGKARALGEALNLLEAALEKVPEPLKSEFKARRDDIINLQAAAQKGIEEAKRPLPHAPNETRQKYQALTELIDFIRQKNPEFMPDSLDIKEIGALTNEIKQPVVYLLTTMHGSLALIVTPNHVKNEETVEKQKPEIHPVWRKQFTTSSLSALLNLPNQANGYLAKIVSGEPEALMRELDSAWHLLQTTLVKPVAKKVKDLNYAQAFLVPIGLLTMLPLPALVLDDITFSMAPSARALQSAWSRQQQVASDPTLLGVGNPLPHPNPLHFARQEVDDVAQYFADGNKRLLLEQEATKESIETALAGTTYLHLACHGRFEVERPLTSTLYFAGESSWRLYDVLDPKLDLHHIRLGVLSACRTGITEFKKLPDEAIGFPAVFLQAGLQGIISTLWAVNDVSTTLLMTRFYALHLGKQLPPAIALCQAQRWLRDKLTLRRVIELIDVVIAQIPENDLLLNVKLKTYRRQLLDDFDHDLDKRPFSHPYYWAAFTMTGV